MNKFMRNATDFTEAFGVRHAPLVVWLSLIPWDDDDRANFIYKMTGRRFGRAFTAVDRLGRPK